MVVVVQVGGVGSPLRQGQRGPMREVRSRNRSQSRRLRERVRELEERWIWIRETMQNISGKVDGIRRLE